MADISLIIDVQQKGVVKAVKDTKSLESNVKLLSKAFKSGDLSQRQYYKGISQLAKETKKSETELRDFATTLRRVESETKKAKIAADAEKRAIQDYAKARRQATEENRRFEAEQRKAAKTARDVALANRRLRMEFQEGYAAKVRLRAEQMRLSAAMRKGIIDTDQYKLAMDRLGQAAGRSGKHMNRSGVIVQQTGYQVGDFLVQVQSGTNAMVAFGQQATQIAGTLTILGGKWIAIGSALGIAIPLLTAVGAYFMRTAKSADETSDSVETLEDKIKSLDSTVQDWLTTRRAASMGITVQELLGTQNVQDAQKAVDDARTALNNLLAQTPQNNAGGFSPRAGVEVRLAADLADLFEKQADAKQKLLDAERLLADLERKNAVERFSNFREEAYELNRQLQLQQDIAKFGRDSSQVRATELKNSIDSYNRQIQAQVRSNDLTQTQADILIKLNAEILTSQDSYDTMLSNQEVLKDGADSFLSIWTSITAQFTKAKGELISMATLQSQMGASVSGGRSSGAGGQTVVPRGTYRAEFLKQLGIGEDSSTGGGGGRSSPEREAKLNLDAYQESLKEVIALENERKALIAPMATSFTDGLTAIVEGTKSVKDAFKDMAREVIKQLWDIYVTQQIVSGITGMFGNAATTGMNAIPSNNPLAGMSGSQMLPQANGGAWSKGVQMFANGGVVNSPTMFGHSGGVGVMGEAGPEAIMPLKRGANGKLGVQMEGGGSQPVVINQSFNFAANGDESVKKIIAQAAPQIAQMTQQKMMDQRRRGGAMKSTFG